MPKNCVVTADAGCPGYEDIIIPENQIYTAEWMRIRSDIECFFSAVKTFRSCKDRIRENLREGKRGPDSTESLQHLENISRFV